MRQNVGVHERPPLMRRIARWRVPVGFATAVVVLWLAHPTRATLLSGGLIAAAGELLRIWAAGHLNKSREVTSSGPYRLMSHPLYAGSAVMGLGLSIASNSAVVVAVVLAYLAIMLSAAVRSEEAFLRAAFGDEYERYRSGVAGQESTRRFSLTRALANHEPRAIAGLLTAALLLFLKATYNGSF
jgi:hypothetical protein